MSTPLKRQTNRANARRSTGPRTERGRAAVSSNPLTHGFYSAVAIPLIEDPADFHSTLADYIADLRPAGATEVELVHRYVKDLWKLRRLERLERMFVIQAIQRHESSVDAAVFVPELRPAHAHFDIIDLQFHQYKTTAPIERVSILQNRLRRGLDSTLRLLRELQHERFASAAPGEEFAVTTTLPPDDYTYFYDPPPDPDDKKPVPDDENPGPANPGCDSVADPSPVSKSTPDSSASADRGMEPQPKGPVVFQSRDRQGAGALREVGQTPTSAPDPQVRPPRSTPAHQTPPNGPKTPPPIPTIHKPNPEFGFAPSKITSRTPNHPKRRSKERR